MKHVVPVSKTADLPIRAMALLEKQATVQNLEQTLTQLIALAGIVSNLKHFGERL